MTLRRREYLFEASVGRIKYDMDKYKDELWSEIEEVLYRSERKVAEGDPYYVQYPYTEKMAKDDLKRLAEGTRKNLAKIARNVYGAMKRVPEWKGSNVLIKPHYYVDRYGFGDNPLFSPIEHANVKLYSGSTPGRGADFTHFGDGEIEDVIEGGDLDFFRNSPELETDYFNLIAELRQPGSLKATKSKRLTLFTARPKKDRSVYERAKKVPHGIFLTTSFDRAAGFGSDFGGESGRDIYQVVIDSKYLTKTLDTGRIKDYQVTNVQGAPVVHIERA